MNKLIKNFDTDTDFQICIFQKRMLFHFTFVPFVVQKYPVEMHLFCNQNQFRK